ncbi:bridge-like lipid transfer protein family member 1 isoform X7 [Armigeres subalbatus]|uniref:bridge-like lipid transfer protein family member 1 isoform X7 n=1 Tax=Armigeres subalbatus TaxID=124917 RepID=UPI002ED13760
MSYEVSEGPDLIDLDLDLSMGQFNTTQSIEDMKLDKNMVWLLLSLLTSIIWVVYITFYNSRLFAYFITKLVNRLFVRGAYFKIGSLNVNPLAGKIMFRDFVYVNYDYTVRVQDGYFIFRWWRSYVPKDVSEDLSHSDTRLSVMLNGYELHVYNRSDLYAKLERTFGLKPSVLIPTENMSAEEIARFKEQAMNYENQRQSSEQHTKLKKPRPEAMTATTWRDLIPVIKIDICSGRFVFGNRLTPTTLSICVEEAHCVYSTKPAVSKLDHFMHFVKAKVENAKVLLAPSPKYTGLVDEPPRYMGEGFVVMMSNNMELYFYMDEAGIVPEEPVTLTLANGDVVEASPPVWGIDIKCGKGTDFSYGPWADRQRDNLFKFFFPPDYQAMQVTKPPKPGDRREMQSFDVNLCTLNEATIDILFSKNKETNAVHVNIGAGSCLEVTLPWITLQDGFTTKVTGQLLHVEATTSLQYRSLAECETLQFNVKVHYPVRWNAHQEWTINLTGTKATAYIVYSHKYFFTDLIDDWASKARPDILSFVPYTWKFGVILQEFEIITLSNEFNWIDCSSTNQENHHLAFCGDLFDLSFTLPFDDFLPLKIPIVFWIHGEGLDLSMYLPEQSSTKPILVALDKNARILTRDGNIKKRTELLGKKWRKVCQRSTGWIDCWSVPIVALSIKYMYHPMPPLGPDPQADITTPEKEEILLSPMRIPKMRKSPAITWNDAGQPRFDPTSLPPDQVTVDVEIGSSVMLAYGAILRNFIHLKENIFGEDQSFTDMENSNSKSSTAGRSRVAKSTSSKDDPNKSVSEASCNAEEKPKRFDPRLYRPLEVTVNVTIHDLQAHVIKNCNENDPPCPVVLIERLGFEMKKRFHETELQVLVSPSFLISSDSSIRPSKDKHLKQGHLLLSAVQVRGHAMFSNEGRQLDEETLEYAWLLEVQLGKLSGKMTLPQLCNIVTGLETLAFLTMDSENELKSPKTVRYCHHGIPTNVCPHTKEDAKYRCPSTEDIKYRMTRVAIDAVDLYLIENGTALHTWISPLRIATCNLHGQQVKSGVTGLIPTILLRQFVSTGGHFSHSNGNSHSNTNTTGSNRSAKIRHQNSLKHESDQKEDTNPLYKRVDDGGAKAKKLSEQHQQQAPPHAHTHRRDSKEDPYGSLPNRRSHDSEHFRREKEEIYASIHSNNRNSNRDIDSTEPWLEVGCLSLGPIIIEAASALPIPEHCLHLVQHNYLKLHDERNKKLWFLWANTSDSIRCGCVGGCAFFGSNRNGARFFKPSAQDLQDFINIARYHIHPNPREYGFGQSLLHEDQLVFHTPPYSMQPVSLQECYDYVGKPNLRSTRHCTTDSKSPLPPKHEAFMTQKQCDVSPNSTMIRSGGDKSGKSSLERVKEKDSGGSPLSADRSRGRRFSYTSARQNTISHDVPYYRLLESSPKANSSRISSSMRQDSESRLLTPKAIKMQAPKTSASDSRLTMEYFQGDDTVSVLEEPTELSQSAPQPHPLESDSEHSLSPKVPPEDVIIRDVQRTVSLTSENPSEAFFSADEDLHASRSSSLKAATDLSTVIPKKRFASDLSIVGPNEMEGKLSTHRSDYEIHTPEHRSLPMRPQSTAELNDEERRIHGLATPLRKFSNISPRPEFRHFKPVYDVDPHDSSESHSLSSSSFISALSSQEDITLVNLHMQINRPIVDSPLLMASYVTHLAQVRCSNWSHCSLPLGADAFSMPLFQQNEDGGLVYIGSRLVPHFDNYSNWREVKIISRYDGSSQQQTSTSGMSTLPKPHPWDPSVMVRGSFEKQESKEHENEFLSSQGETATRNSVVIRFKGQVDVMLTPLLLEGLQRMIESLIPTLSTLHPLTIINDVHASCVRKVEAVNILKRDQSLSYWSQVHSNSKRSTAERNLQGPGGPVLTDVYEESISTQLQGLIVLPKVNVSLIQSSVIEEVISFAALDNVQELSCASLLAVCFEGVSTRFHLGKTTKASMHTVYTQPTVRTGGLKKSGLIRGTRALLAHLSSQSRPDNIPGEPVLLETSEKQLEELIITLDVGKAHAQLRRLKNDPVIMQDSQIVITAIPYHRSRAMFDCTKIPEEPTVDGNSGMGYIMFECGLEGVSVKIVKRSQFEKSENAEEALKPTPEPNHTEANESSITGNNPLNLVTLLNEAGVSAEALAKIGIKKPSTPKTGTPKDRTPKDKTSETRSPRPEETDQGTDRQGSNGIGGERTIIAAKNDNGKTSSCVIDFKTVWFNFAAPPRTPITRKIDYSRLDWNLLSTASPAITAWMNPSNRFAIKIVALIRAMYVRRTAVLVALMADAWERQTVHRPLKSRYPGMFTPLAKTLQEDPSCLLCTMLQKYVLEETVAKIENDLKQQYVPQLGTLRQAVIVLSRQWKNVLYNPMLFEHQYKGKLNNPISVTFALPQDERYKPIWAPSSRSSMQMFPIIFDKHDPQIEYGALKEGSLPSVCSSSDSMDKPWTPPPNQKEDLYSWMAKQQNGNSKNNRDKNKQETARQTSKNRPEIHSIKYMNENNRILDAHLIFEPMLTCLGVMPQQMINNVSNTDVSSLDSLGTNLSLVCSFDTMRIDIVVSEAGDAKKPKPKMSKKGNGKFSLIMPTEQPAFLCEHVGVELELLKMTDGFSDDAKQHMLYVSRGQLKKHTSTVINFSLNVRYLSQQVNMPLLRLLHQITNMYQNVKDAQNELRDHPEHGKRSVPLKDESSLASEMNDPTLMGSLNEPLMSHIDNTIFDYADERYDKFNEDIPIRHELRHSVSRSKMPSLGPLIPLTPSPSSRNRPHSFAQKLRSTGKSVKGKLGYTNLNETIQTPIKASPTALTFADALSRNSLEAKNSLTGGLSSTYGGPNVNEAFVDITAPFDRSTFTGPIHSMLDTPKCWKTIYHLLDLYSAMPETKTISHRVSLSPDAAGQFKARKYNILPDIKTAGNRNDEDDVGSGTPLPKDVGMVAQERTRLVVFGVAKIHRTRLLATLSGLKLEAEITALHCSTTWRKKSRPASLECSLTGQVGRAMIVLLEGLPPNQQTVVKVTIGKSQTLYSSITRKGKDKNNGLLSIGIVNIDIPQHPVALHGMMTRGSKQISSTLQELRVTRTSGRMTRQNEEPESPLNNQREARDKVPTARKQSTTTSKVAANNPNGLLQPLVMQFNVILQSLSVTAALLPSLQAQYKMDHVTSTGVTGSKAKFTVDLPNHTLSFTTKAQATETNLPSEACIALPPVHVSAEYVPESSSEEAPIDGVVLRQGGYLAASAEIGVFERCLSTDLLNHLVFVQKVFMKEVNEVVQKVYGGEKPVPIWLEDGEDNGAQHIKRLLFSLNIRVKRIQLTATTPCNSAVRFETGQLDLHLSNRVKNLAEGANTKLFGKAQIDLNLSLGQIIKNVIFDEAEPEFQQYAFFNTTIGLRNAFQDEMVNDDKELVLITLKRPLIYVQPIAVDKAILVWLNYKNAYEYWTEKRANLNKEVLMATQQVFEKVPFEKLSQHLATANLSTLFLQLTVEDMGICLPLNQPPQHWGNRSVNDFEQKRAVVITLENTIISACSCGSLVSKGRFVGLCLRFAEDFDSSLDDWKPNMNDSNIMNLCVVSDGTYEVCSRTIAAKHPDNAKWFLNVTWQMEGVDIHLDVNIGKQLSALGHTLTMLTGSEDEDPISSDTPDSDDADQSEENRASQEYPGGKGRKSIDSLPQFLFDTTLDPKKRSMMMENEIAEQTKTVNDLRSLGASSKTIENEERRLQGLQAICYKYFRRDMLQKWKRPTIRKTMLKATNRSRSFIAPSPTREDLIEQGEGSTSIEVTGNDGLLNSLQESPNPGPSRTASLKVKIPQANRVTFTEAMRQSSLPSADSETGYSDSGFDWPRCDGSLTTLDTPDLLEIDGEQVELRKKSPNHPQKQQEPNIDFELDIKVLVKSGKCVLHTKDLTDDKMSTSVSSTIKHHKRERSIGTDWGSPVPPRRSKEKARLKYSPHTALVDLTIFHIPGLDVKLQYQSRIIDDDASPRLSTGDPFAATRKHGLKRATLFAWMTLQSIPEETIISPHILEFLEQTLEPIPSKAISVPSNPVNLQMLENNYAVYASFPVDVVVYFHMQPSTFRFSCLPISRVECMLQLPSLDIIFSSNRQDDVPSNIGLSESDAKSAGGLSVTGCLADFNVYIFHPYGGKKTNLKESHQFSPLADSERKDSLSINVEFVKFHITRSKKINYETGLSRKMSDQSKAVIRFSTIVDIGSASFKYDMRRLTEILAFPKAWYRRSIVRRMFLGDLSIPQVSMCDLESVSEGSSMRAGTDTELPQDNPETLSRDKMKLSLEDDLPKHSVGSSSSTCTTAKLKDRKSSSMDSNTSPSDVNQVTSWETLVLFAVNFTKLNVQMNMGNVMGNIVWLTKAFRSDGRLSIGSTGHKNMYIGVGLGGSSLDAKGGIVGGTIELSKIDTFIHIREDPGCEPDHKVGIKLLALELKFDYMGTSVLMTRISSLSAQLRDQWKFSKDHDFSNTLPTNYPAIILIHGDLSWDQLQMMISKSTTADILKMFYKLEEFFSQQFKSSKRVFSNLEPRLTVNNRSSVRRKESTKKNLTVLQTAAEREISHHDARHHRHWQRPLKQTKGLWLSTLGVPLSNIGTVLGGTMELHGKNISLACFHGVNFKSKSWALFSLKEPCINFATEAQHVECSEEVHIIQTLTFGLGMNSQQPPQHHSNATVVRMSRNVIFPPQFKTLHEWFHYAFANSEIDAVDRFPVLERDKEHHTNSIERARGGGGTSSHPKLQDPNHNREVIFALPSLQLHFKTEHLQGISTPEACQEKPLVECSFITEFEDHIFVTVDADAFFFLHDLITSYLKEKEKVLGTITSARAASPSPQPTTPSPSPTPEVSSLKPVKSACQLGASSMHDLSSSSGSSVANGSAVNLNDIGASGSSNRAASEEKQSNSKNVHIKVDKAENEVTIRTDWRHFNCKTWHLEPTVRLLSWAGKSIEPYGIDYILNKLGFSHARTTIPKWLQRGVMDPLDKVEAMLMLQLLLMARENDTDGKDQEK